MNTATKFDLKARAVQLLRGPVPKTVLNGDSRMAVDYRNQCSALRAFVRTGAVPERVLTVVLRVEGMSAGAVRMGPGGMDPHGAARSETHGNHGHNLNLPPVTA